MKAERYTGAAKARHAALSARHWQEIQAGGRAVAITDSVADWDGAAPLVEHAVKEFGRLDVVVNNAGILRDAFIAGHREEAWDAMVAVHPKGPEAFVSRGTYALTDNQKGTITWQMWGGGHTFQKGDTIRVELLAQDVPLERLSPRQLARGRLAGPRDGVRRRGGGRASQPGGHDHDPGPAG